MTPGSSTLEIAIPYKPKNKAMATETYWLSRTERSKFIIIYIIPSQKNIFCKYFISNG
jgi:hypothetical protein